MADGKGGRGAGRGATGSVVQANVVRYQPGMRGVATTREGEQILLSRDSDVLVRHPGAVVTGTNNNSVSVVGRATNAEVGLGRDSRVALRATGAQVVVGDNSEVMLEGDASRAVVHGGDALRISSRRSQLDAPGAHSDIRVHAKDGADISVPFVDRLTAVVGAGAIVDVGSHANITVGRNSQVRVMSLSVVNAPSGGARVTLSGAGSRVVVQSDSRVVVLPRAAGSASVDLAVVGAVTARQRASVAAYGGSVRGGVVSLRGLHDGEYHWGPAGVVRGELAPNLRGRG